MAKVGLNLNSENQVTAIYLDGTEGDILIDATDDVNTLLNSGKLLKYENGELTVDDVATQNNLNLQERENLIQQLADTDYVLAKITEYNILNKELTEDYTTKLNNRQTWRDRVQEIDQGN